MDNFPSTGTKTHVREKEVCTYYSTPRAELGFITESHILSPSASPFCALISPENIHIAKVFMFRLIQTNVSFT